MANYPEVEALRKVDLLDTQILKLRREIRDAPEDLTKHQTQAKAAADRVQRCHDEVKRLQREIDKIELDTRSNNDQIKKYQVQQNTAKTNEEYSTLKRQVEVIRKQNAELEDKALGYYEQVDKLKAEEGAYKAGVKEADAKLKAEVAEVQKDVGELERRLGELLAERTIAEQKVSAQNLTMYRRILEKLGNRALAAIHGRTCQGCYIEIAPNALSMLLSGKEVVQCKHCARILYLENDYKAVSPMSFLVTERDRGDHTSKDGNW